jgi:hypothetical protein
MHFVALVRPPFQVEGALPTYKAKGPGLPSLPSGVGPTYLQGQKPGPTEEGSCEPGQSCQVHEVTEHD